MAQRSGDDELADRLGGISLESVSAGEGKAPIGPAGLIHKVRDVTLPSRCWLDRLPAWYSYGRPSAFVVHSAQQ